MLRDHLAARSLVVALACGCLTARAETKEALRFPVVKDASLIERSLCCGDASDKNFGTAPTVDAGAYHHRARALFGYSTDAVARERIAKVELVLPPAQIVGGAQTEVRLLVVTRTATWDEGTVTHSDAPSATEVGVFRIEALSEARLDVTSAFADGVPAGEVSFIVEATRANVFFPSREEDPGNGNALVVTAPSAPPLPG
jgi:hypothetical protein